MASLAAFSADAADRYANVEVDAVIKCISCEKRVFQNRFSHSQMNKYKEAVGRERHGGPKAKLPRCIACTPHSVHELRCTGCNLTKELNQFSKQQRAKPDIAKCWDCQQEIEDRVPSLEDAMAEERIREDYRQKPHSSTSTSVHASTSGSAFPSTSASGPGPRNRPADYAPSDISSQDDFGRDFHARPPSPTSTEISTDHTFSYSGTASKGNFVKLSAYQAPIHTKVKNQMEREARQKQQQMATKVQDDDDDGSDWEL